MTRPTDLEIFKATVEHRPQEHFLFYAGYTSDLLQRMLAHCGCSDEAELSARFGAFMPAHIRPQEPDNPGASDFAAYYADMEIPEGAFINKLGVMHVPGSSFHFTHSVSPLRNADTLAEVEKFPFPPMEGWSTDHMAAEAQAAHEAGRVVYGDIGHMYENAWQIRGYEEFLMDMMAAPEICEYILDRFFEANLKRAVAAAEAGADLLNTADDVANQRAMMFRPELWRRFMKSRWARVYAAAREIKPDIAIWYHCDGNLEEIIPDLIEIGVTILNPVQPECLDLAGVKQRYGRHLVFDGTIGTQTTMPFGTPDEVRSLVRQRKMELGRDGALILSPTHVLEPEVPLENIVAFYEAAAEPLKN